MLNLFKSTGFPSYPPFLWVCVESKPARCHLRLCSGGEGGVNTYAWKVWEPCEHLLRRGWELRRPSYKGESAVITCYKEGELHCEQMHVEGESIVNAWTDLKGSDLKGSMWGCCDCMIKRGGGWLWMPVQRGWQWWWCEHVYPVWSERMSSSCVLPVLITSLDLSTSLFQPAAAGWLTDCITMVTNFNLPSTLWFSCQINFVFLYFSLLGVSWT